MPRAVITGGAGFLGSHLIDRLLSEGYDVSSVDNFITGSRENLQHLDREKGLTLLEQDVTKPLEIEGAVDVVLHLASPASPEDYRKYPIQTLKVGALGTHVTLGLAKAKAARYLLASSSEVYGDPLVNPQPEEYWGNVNPIGPRGVYDEAKRYAEAMAMAYHQEHGIPTHIARIFNSVIGEEPVVLVNDQKLHVDPIQDYFESRDPEAVVEAPCFDPDDNLVKRYGVSELIRIPFSGVVYTVRTTYGRQVTVTGDHSVFTHDENWRPTPVPVRELTPGMRIAVPARLDVPSVDLATIDLAESLIKTLKEEELWGYALEDGTLPSQVHDRRRQIADYFWRKHSNAGDKYGCWTQVIRWENDARVPIPVVKRFGLSWTESARLGAYAPGSSGGIPNRVYITEDLLWLLGLYLAEGSQATTNGYLLTITCEGYLLRRARRVLTDAFDVNVGLIPYAEGRVGRIYVNSKPLHTLFLRLFGLEEKRIPRWIMQLPLSRAKWFLEGYREGDGTHSGKSLGKLVAFNTSSPGLARDLVLLLLRFGIVAHYGQYTTTFKQRYGNRRFPFYRISIHGLSDYDILSWDKGFKQNIQRRREGDIIWAVVRTIEKQHYQGSVYDLSVPGTENFVAGNGVFCHNTYGPRMRLHDGRAIPNFVYQALTGEPLTIYGDGTQTRSFCYVDDMIEGLWRLLNSNVHEPINLGNPEEKTVLELAEMIRELVGNGKEFEFRPLPQDDPKVRRPDIARAVKELGWKPKVRLEEGLGSTIEYFRGKIHG